MHMELKSITAAPPKLDTASSTAVIRHAGFWIRFWAYFFDGIIITAVTIGIMFCLFGRPSYPEFHQMIKGDYYMIYVWILYCMVLEASPLQGTFGKRLMDLKVTDEKGNRLDIKRSIIRNLCKLISFHCFALGFIWIGFSQQKQGWHDLLAKTFVVGGSPQS